MAFLKALFGNATDVQDESITLESLETPLSTTDPIRVTPTDPTLMDVQPTLIPVTPTGPTPMDADTTSTPTIPASIILMDANTTPAATPANPPSKLLLREVDESHNLCAQVYDLKKSILKKDAQFAILEGKFCLKDAGTSELEAQIKQRDIVITEQSQLLSQLRQGLDEVKQQTAAQNSVLAQVGSKDAVIAQQSEALQRLQRDLNEVQNQVVLEAKVEIQWLQVDRESELLVLSQKYETTLHKLQESLSAAQGTTGQGQSKLPATELVAPASRNPSDAPRTSTSMPARRGRQKAQGMNEEIETDAQRIWNLACVRDLFKTVFDITQDEDFLWHGGVSSQVAKAFIKGTGPGPDPSQLQWDFNNPASSAWNQAKWTVETQSDQYWVHKITQKFTWIKRHVDRAKPHINNNLFVKTSEDVAMRLATEKDKALMKARRDMQRRTKYQRQKEIMENMVAAKEAKGNDDVVAWRFLSSVIAMLGSDGMSSEDSDGEDTKTVYCTHMLPWRRDIIKELNLIDQWRLEGSSIFSPRGAKAAKHIAIGAETCQRSTSLLL
ncbi:hypothetical protein EDC04DRAFT_2907736 [Pisolithus marmoratus]|nr:hypothetical protein EDC04DRAFT_2907736 [Pisolithus marmoratus]